MKSLPIQISVPYRKHLARWARCSWYPGVRSLPTQVRDADVLLVRSVTPVNAALLDGSRVKFVATATIGTTTLIGNISRKMGSALPAHRASNANSVAEYVVVAMLALAHRRRFRLRDKTLGVIGVGNVGSRVVSFAEALACAWLQNRSAARAHREAFAFRVLDRLLAEADIITPHLPLTPWKGPETTFTSSTKIGSVHWNIASQF